MTDYLKQFYVYRISCSHPKSVFKYYYGSRSCNCQPSEDRGYWSSSKVVKQARKLYGAEYFHKKILAIFQNRSEALKYEVRLHKRFNVKDHPLFFNQANQTLSFFCYTRCTLDQKTKISINLKRYYQENPVRRGSLSELLKIRHNSTNNVFGSIRRGAKHSDQTKKEISAGLKHYYSKLPPKSRAEIISLGLKNSQKVKERNKKVIQCPLCLKKGNGPTMYRWHFSNCALKNTPRESKT